MIAGVLADLVVKRIKVGLIGAIIVGILGAFLGGWLFGLLGISIGSGFIGDVIAAFVGAVILLLVLRAVRGGSAVNAFLTGPVISPTAPRYTRSSPSRPASARWRCASP